MAKDVRKEQTVLLKFEKKLAGLAALWATAGSAAAAAAGTKLSGEATAKAYEDIQAALVQLADVTASAHAALQASAGEVGVHLLVGGGGTPKDPPSVVVRSLLGLG